MTNRGRIVSTQMAYSVVPVVVLEACCGSFYACLGLITINNLILNFFARFKARDNSAKNKQFIILIFYMLEE